MAPASGLALLLVEASGSGSQLVQVSGVVLESAPASGWAWGLGEEWA